MLRLAGLALAAFAAPCIGNAQTTLYFSASDAGVTKSIDWWGMDTAWPSADNMRQGVEHMGADQIDVVRVNFYIDEPLQADGSLGPNTRARLDTQLGLAEMPGAKPIAITPNSGDATDPWYLNGNQVRVDRWTQVIQATRDYIAQQGQTVIEVEPFNEPDFWAGQGTPQNLHSVMTALRADPDFANVKMVGASTLNSDNAASWYNAISGPVDYGATHVLAGSADTYVSFIEQVKANGDVPYNPEIHSFGEVLYGAEYGLEGGIWWGPAYKSRGLIVNSVQGQRLAYGEDRVSNTAAAVYRDPDGAVRAFAGGFERDYQGVPRSYRLVSTDQDFYFNGVGPIREYTIHAGQNDQGAYVDIQSEADAPPPLDGSRWRLVNRYTGEILEVSGAGLADGADIRVGADSGGLHQRWDIERSIHGYYTLTAAHSGRTAEIGNWSLEDGANAWQWGTGDNILQQWLVEQAPDGYYYVRNGHSNKYLTANTTGSVYQGSLGRNKQVAQWEFQLANPHPTESITASYSFESSASDGVGSNHATLTGGPAYATGVSGAALVLDGVNDYATLPSGIVDTDDFTFAAWVRWDGGADWQRVFDFGDDTTNNMFLTPSANDGTMRFAITTGSYSEEQLLITDGLPTGEWVHLAVTLGGNTGVLYVNGEPRVAGQIVLNPSDLTPTNNYLGKSQYPDALFDGMLDDVRLYDRALDAQQIALLARPGDFNADGLVDAADYVVWREGLGDRYLQSGYDLWRDNYGRVYNVAAGPGASAVPEPAAAALLAAALAALTRRPRSQRPRRAASSSS